VSVKIIGNVVIPQSEYDFLFTFPIWNLNLCVYLVPFSSSLQDANFSYPRQFGTGTFRAQDLSFPRTNSPLGELSFPRLFVPWTFRSEELLFLRLFYKALAMNADSYSNCQNLFHRMPSSDPIGISTRSLA